MSDCHKGCPDHTACEAVVHQLLEVEAQITVTPLIKHGEPKVFCLETEIKPGCLKGDCPDQHPVPVESLCHLAKTYFDGHEKENESAQESSREKRKTGWQMKKESEKPRGKCTFTVAQTICVEIPIAFDVDVDVDKGVVCCHEPDIGPCTAHDGVRADKPGKKYRERMDGKAQSLLEEED